MRFLRSPSGLSSLRNMLRSTARIFREPFTSPMPQYVLHSLLLQRITRWHLRPLYFTFSFSPVLHSEQHLDVRCSSTLTTVIPSFLIILRIFFTGGLSCPLMNPSCWDQSPNPISVFLGSCPSRILFTSCTMAFWPKRRVLNLCQSWSSQSPPP